MQSLAQGRASALTGRPLFARGGVSTLLRCAGSGGSFPRDWLRMIAPCGPPAKAYMHSMRSLILLPSNT